jgi:hypothetical protein
LAAAVAVGLLTAFATSAPRAVIQILKQRHSLQYINCRNSINIQS